MTSGILLLLALFLLSAAFSSSETALFSLDSIRLQTLVRKGNPKAVLIQKLKSDPKILLGTILLGNNAANVGASALATMLTIETFGQVWVGVATGVLTLALLIFSEFIPKAWAAHNAERASFIFARPIYALTVVFAPVVRVLNRIVAFVLRQEATGMIRPRVSEDEIKTMASLGVKAGTLEKQEKELIERVFLFNDITAEDVMTPKEDVEFLDGDWTIKQALPLINEEKFSRYPVYEGDDDTLLGIVHIKDIFERLAERPETAMDSVRIRDVVGQVMYVPETKLIDDLFREFQRLRAHMAIVVNEYGSMVGLVTTDDLLEELVGEIGDETDVEDNVIKRVDKTTIIAHGDEEIKDINAFMNWKITGQGNKTISRIILERLGSLPQTGERAMVEPEIEAEVLEMENLRIVKVRLCHKPAPKPEETAA